MHIASPWMLGFYIQLPTRHSQLGVERAPAIWTPDSPTPPLGTSLSRLPPSWNDNSRPGKITWNPLAFFSVGQPLMVASFSKCILDAPTPLHPDLLALMERPQAPGGTQGGLAFLVCSPHGRQGALVRTRGRSRLASPPAVGVVEQRLTFRLPLTFWSYTLPTTLQLHCAPCFSRNTTDTLPLQRFVFFFLGCRIQWHLVHSQMLFFKQWSFLTGKSSSLAGKNSDGSYVF